MYTHHTLISFPFNAQCEWGGRWVLETFSFEGEFPEEWNISQYELSNIVPLNLALLVISLITFCMRVPSLSLSLNESEMEMG